jgi:N-acetylglutamate synthase-like GNAT family acetyltransferase
VVPEERDTGVGRRLVDALLGLSRELGLEHVTVHANERSRALYQRHGFECSPLLLFWDGSTTVA